jgi:probable HAF family extracellular repeat protein
VLWTPYGISDLGTLEGGNDASASAISNDLVVGWSDLGDWRRHAFIYDTNGPGHAVDLNDLIGSDSGWLLEEATGINAAGQIVGFGQFNTERYHAFLLTPVQPTTPPRWTVSRTVTGQAGNPGSIQDVTISAR